MGGLKVAPTLISTRRVVSAKMVNLRGGGLKMVRKINQAWGFAKYPVFVGVLKIVKSAIPHADFYQRGVSAKMANLRGGSENGNI